MSVGLEIRRLARHSAIYGLGGVVSRALAILLLPVYTSYLGTRGFGKIETIAAATAVAMVVLRLGLSGAFLRFYFDGDDRRRATVVSTAFWFTMATATAGLVLTCVLAHPIAHVLRLGDDVWLVRAAALVLWGQINYDQVTALYRAEERSVAYVIATVANILVTVGATVLFVVVLKRGATGAVIGNGIGTVVVFLALLVRRHSQLSFRFDRSLLAAMVRFGLPLLPVALGIWAVNFIDRFFVAVFKGQGEVGVYSLAARVSGVVVFVLMAFRLSWPAFAWSIGDDALAKRTYAYVLTYLLFLCAWISIALATLAPWIVQALAPTNASFHRADKAIGLLAFAGTLYAGYTVVEVGAGRVRRMQMNWLVGGAGAVVNVALNVALIPRFGMMGAAISTVASFGVLFVAMTALAQRLYVIPYQWRRVGTLLGVAVVLAALGLAARSFILAVVLTAAYPLVLAPLRFYLPSERTALRKLLPRRARATLG